MCITSCTNIKQDPNAPNVIFYNVTRFQYNQGQENFINYSAIKDIKDGDVSLKIIHMYTFSQTKIWNTATYLLSDGRNVPL